MPNVYWVEIGPDTPVESVKQASRRLLEAVLAGESVALGGKVPLKVHFGEKGNKTYIKPENYDGVIDFLQERGMETLFIETSVMYGGQRYNRDLHMKTATEHGFTRIPVVIADGEQGEDFVEVESGGKHFKTCKIGKTFLEFEQLIILSHFKGHLLSGFGGAIKQLSMGHASKGGKLAMHMGIKPQIKNRKCRKCELCMKRCNVQAITIGERSRIDHSKCVGCGACVAICPHKAIGIFTLKGVFRALFLRRAFREKLVEYALAARKDKRNVYMNFAMSITKGCDCEPRSMKPVIPDFGIFASTDPVAIDKACFDMAAAKGRKFAGADQFAYARKMGLGSTEYSLIPV